MNREISRQLIHAFAGTIIIASVALLGRELSLLLAALIFFIGLMLSMLVRVGVKADMLESLLKKVQRDYEKHFPGFGALMFFLGMVLLLFFFQMHRLSCDDHLMMSHLKRKERLILILL